MNYFALPGIRRDDTKELLITPANVLRVICDHFHLDIDIVKRKGRVMENSYARQLFMYIMRNYSAMTFKTIAGYFGQDHTTCIHAVNQIKNRMSVEDYVKRDVAAIEKKLLLVEKPNPHST